MRNVVFCLVLPLMGFGLHPQDTADPLQQEVDISSAGLERRKALLRTERPGFPDWKELDVDATGAVSDVSPSALTEQTPEEMAAPILPGQVMTFESMPGLDPMQDAINSIMGDLMPYKEEVEKLNTTESKKSNKTKEEKLKKMKEEVKKDMVDLPKKVEASMNETKKRQEVLRLEAPCWKECQTCRFKETQAADECYATPEEAMVACSEAPCSGISTQRKECNGTWSIFIGSPEKVEMTVEELLTLKHRTWTLDRECLKMSSVNASKYIIFLTNASWTDAAKSCAEEKLEMATPYTKQDMKALTAAMQLAGAEKVHIGLHRDAQEGQGPWTNESAFYWINGEKLEKDWPGWGGYGLASLEENILDAGLPVRQPHLEAFLEGCVYVGYFQTLSEDGTKGAGDTTCDFFHIPFACQAIEERAVVVSVTTTTSTWPWRYGLAMEGSNACPSVKGVKAVPLERCQEAALEAVLPRGAKRSRSILQTGYDLGRDETQPWLTAPPGCSLNSGRDWAPIFNMGTGANNGDYTPLCMQPLPNAVDLTNSMEVVETTFDSDRTGKYFHLYFPAEDWEAKTAGALSTEGSTQSVTQYRNQFPVWTGIVRVWRNMLGVQGRREFNAMEQQWHTGDLIKVEVTCPFGFSLVPFDLDGPNEMHFDAKNLEGCAKKCVEQGNCSSFEFAYAESACNVFSNNLEDFKGFLGRPNQWISCVRAELLSRTVGTDGAPAPLLEKPHPDPYAWKKLLGNCAFADGTTITSGFSVGNMSLTECHESCRTQMTCTAYEMVGLVGICHLHTSIYAVRGTEGTGATCYIRPVLLSCGTYNSQDCAESYAIAEHIDSTTEFCQKCLASDGLSLFRDRCQLCCEKCPMMRQDASPTVAGGVNASRHIECNENTFDLDGDAANGCEVGCPKVPGANCLECPNPSNCSRMMCADNYYDADGNESNGCEILCPAVNNAVCKKCEQGICTTFDCKEGFYDADWNIQNGCEAPCPVVPHADCTLCQGPFVCKDYKCHQNYFEVDGNNSNGCEKTCATVPHGKCPECHNPSTCAVALTCDKDYYDADGLQDNGCEVLCPSVTHGSCIACSGHPLECFDMLCEPNWFDVDGQIQNGCEVGCPSVEHGLCTACSSPEHCTEVQCYPNRFDADEMPSNGCEAGCPEVQRALCLNCTSATSCSQITVCEANFFNDDEDPRNGCEATCPTVPGGECKVCSSSSECSSVMCHENFFNADGDANNGCEATCAVLLQADCKKCYGPGTCAVLQCAANWADSDGDVMTGCEMQCGEVPHATCADCLVVGGCSKLKCDANFFDDDGYPENGCEAVCPNVTHGHCTNCSSSSQCTKIDCEPNWFDADRDHQSCEVTCDVPGGQCLHCGGPDNCTKVKCHEGYYDEDGNARNGCEILCPTVAHGICTTCHENGGERRCSSVLCETNWFDMDETAANGCEAGCATLHHANCLSCTRPGTCNKISCEKNWFNEDGNLSNGCEETCPPVPQGTCVHCQSPEVCEKLECHSNYFDVDGAPDNGCETTCPRVIWGLCLECSQPDVCDKLTSCPPNHFNFDGDNSNGCEGTCMNVSGGTCTSCTTVDNCKAVKCYNNSFDTDGNASNGCEDTCSFPLNAECVHCHEANTCELMKCHRNYYDADHKISTGCEVLCPSVDGASCTACADVSTCTSVQCDLGRSNADGDPTNGCEVSCPEVAHGLCVHCGGVDNCTVVRCHENWFNLDHDAMNGCEAQCPEVPNGI